MKPAAAPPRRFLEAMMITIRFFRLTEPATANAWRPARPLSSCAVEAHAGVPR